MTNMPESAARIEALRDEHCFIPSIDVCSHCCDSECDGIACIAALDPNDERDHEAIENLHSSLREAQAWRIMHVLFAEGEVVAALMLAQEALAIANNQTTNGTCERCGQWFPAQAPCDDTCTSCRLVSVGDDPAPQNPDMTVRLPAAVEAWLDGHFAGEKDDDPDELTRHRNVVAVALWSLMYHQGDPEDDQAALDALVNRGTFGFDV